MAAILKNLDYIQNDVMEIEQPNSKINIDFIYMKDPKVGTGKKPKGSSRRLYTDEDSSDTVPIKFSSVKDVKDTIRMLEKLYKSDERPHVRISQIAQVMRQRMAVINKKDERYILANRYSEFLKKRTKEQPAGRKKMIFKF
jgi:hypothetical protein